VRVRLAPLVQQLQQQSAGKLLVIEGSPAKRVQLGKALATHLGYGSGLQVIASKYAGQMGKSLNELLAQASHAGSILFFDEADALFGRRSEVKDAHDRYANIEISVLLLSQRLVILGVGSRSSLPPELLQRSKVIAARDHWLRSLGSA
jgi:hypothetical protein